MAERWLRWDSTNKKWQESTDLVAFTDMVENPLHEKVIFNAIAAPSGVASKGVLYYDSTADRFKISENNGAFSNLCREAGYPATGLDINALTEDTVPDDLSDFAVLYDVSATANKKVKPKNIINHGCALYNSTNQTYTQSTVKTLAFDSEYFDTDDYHSTTVNNTRITIPTGLGGVYLVGGSTYITTTGAMTQHNLRVTKNVAGTIMAIEQDHGPSTDSTKVLGSIAIRLNDGDYIELADSCSGTGTATVNRATNYSANFWAVRVGA